MKNSAHGNLIAFSLYFPRLANLRISILHHKTVKYQADSYKIPIDQSKTTNYSTITC